MLQKPKCPVIAIEEHYWDRELAGDAAAVERSPRITDRLLEESGEVRLKEMDEAGVDIQVLSHGAPSAQKLPADTAVAITRGVNDRLAAICAAHPKRFAGFAALSRADARHSVFVESPARPASGGLRP